MTLTSTLSARGLTTTAILQSPPHERSQISSRANRDGVKRGRDEAIKNFKRRRPSCKDKRKVPKQTTLTLATIDGELLGNKFAAFLASLFEARKTVNSQSVLWLVQFAQPFT
jgi:hypothetical protein